MALNKFLSATAVLLLLSVSFHDVEAVDGDLDAACATGSTCTDATNNVCDTSLTPPLCKIKAEETCDHNADKCVTGATCTTDGATDTCVCGNGLTKDNAGFCSGASVTSMSGLLVTALFVITKQVFL